MEKHYTKEQILEAYLNQISFGHGWYGIETAARHYFGKSASQLTLAEAATLAAMPKAPAIYDPAVSPTARASAANYVLALMAQQGYITRAQAAGCAGEPLVTASELWSISVAAPYFVDVVQVQAEARRRSDRNGGYRIYTTLDPVLQQAAATVAYRGHGGGREPSRTIATHRCRTAMARIICREWWSRWILARATCAPSSAAATTATSQFDRAVDGMRQPGSSFKPIVYAAAVASTLRRNAIVGDTAIAIPLPNGNVYRPDNSDREYLGDDHAARGAREVAKRRRGAARADARAWTRDRARAARWALRSPIAPYPSSAIGASAVQPLDLVAAYTTFANLGTPVEPRFIHAHRGPHREGAVHRIRPCAPACDRAAHGVRGARHDARRRRARNGAHRFGVTARKHPGRRKDRDDERQHRRVVHRVDTRSRRRRLARLRQAEDDHTRCRRRSLAAPIWGKMMSRYYALTKRPSDSWAIPPGVSAGQIDRLTGEMANEDTPPDQSTPSTSLRARSRSRFGRSYSKSSSWVRSFDKPCLHL